MKGEQAGRIVVVGGTGRVGSRLCALLGEAGQHPVAASPSTGVDTVTGVGLDAALRGARVVVDVSNPPARGEGDVRDFFTASTSNLLAAEQGGGVRHHVLLSVVGCDVASGSAYLGAKAEQERMVESARVPCTIVRATQYFEFLEGIVEAAGGADADPVRLPPADLQPVAVDDVAAFLAEVAVGGPVGGVIEFAGPEPFSMSEIARRLLAARGDPRQVVEDPLATYFGARLERRTLLPRGEARLGRRRLGEWLRHRRSVSRP